MNGTNSTSDAVEHRGGIEIDTVRDIVSSIVAGGDVNLVLVMEALTDQEPIERTTDGVRELVSRMLQEYHKDVLEAQDGLDKLSTLPPSAQKVRLETLLRHLHGYEHTLRARKLLANFDKPPQAMMITEPITFVFGGEAGEHQPPIHVAKAIKELGFNYQVHKSITSLKTVSGVSKSRHFRGRVLSRSCTQATRASVASEKSLSLGKYWVSSQ